MSIKKLKELSANIKEDIMRATAERFLLEN
jgi:hypothetical protein